MLEPAANDPGAYSGFWTYVLMTENRPVEVNGAIHCRAIGGSLNGGAHS